LISIALRPLPLDIFEAHEGIQITIEVPIGYAQRDQLLGFMESKFPGAEISIVHTEVSDPTVAEALVRYDSATDPAKTESAGPIEDSEAVLMKASDALSAFTKSTQ
jgi:hypothetical protein